MTEISFDPFDHCDDDWSEAVVSVAEELKRDTLNPLGKSTARKEGVPMNDRLAMVLNSGIASSWKTNLVKHLKGERLTRNAAILAKCCDCMSYHAYGRMDCRMPHCSLYPFRPYKDDPTSSSKKPISSRRTPRTTPLIDGSSSDQGKGHEAPNAELRTR